MHPTPGPFDGHNQAASLSSPAYLLAVAATFTADPVGPALAFWMRELGLECEIRFAPYNQVFQQLLDPSGLLAANRNGVNIVLARFEDWAGGGAPLEQTVAQFADALGTAGRT